MSAIAILLLAIPALDQERGKARTVVPADGETVPIRLRLSTPTAHILSAVTFPDPIRQVVSAWDPKDLSVEHAGSKLFLKLLRKVEGHLDIVTATGGHYRLYLVPAPLGAEFDSHVTLLPQGRNELAKRAARSASGALELARAMRLGQIPPGATPARPIGMSRSPIRARSRGSSSPTAAASTRRERNSPRARRSSKSWPNGRGSTTRSSRPSSRSSLESRKRGRRNLPRGRMRNPGGTGRGSPSRAPNRGRRGFKGSLSRRGRTPENPTPSTSPRGPLPRRRP